MIHHDIDQRSAVWHYLRVGKATASDFHKILTPGGKLSSQAEDYAHGIIAEMMIGRPMETPETAWMQRGQELEDQAIEAYEFATDMQTNRGGFWTDDLARYGCSPDRLVGDDGLIEMKCPAPNTHVRYLIEGKMGNEKKPQVQGELLVTGRKWVDLVSYHPELPLLIRRVVRDEPYIDMLRKVLEEFAKQLDAMRMQLEAEYGPFKPIVIPQEQAPAPEGDMDVSDADLDAMISDGIITPSF